MIESYSLGMESKGMRDTIKVTLMDGREIVCTPDHKFKVKSKDGYEFKEAKDLITMNNMNADELIVSVDYTEDVKDNDEKEWNLNVGSYNLNMSDESNREKSLAFARLLGYLHMYDDNRIEIKNNIDVTNIKNDIMLLLNTKPIIGYNNDTTKYIIVIPDELINMLDDNLIHTNKYPKSFIREFLGAYFGRHVNTSLIYGNNVAFIVLDSVDERLNRLIDTLKVNIVNNQDFIAIPSFAQFINNIGFRYNIIRSIELSLVSSYERYHDRSENEVNINEFLTLINYNNTLANIEKIPYWNMKISNIEQSGQQNVYDIGVATTHLFSAEGVTISNCIPSRMTIGQLFESVFSKVGAIRGEMIDATPFNNFDFTKIFKELKEYGFNEYGYEHLYCGMTGKKLPAMIFIGPTFYLRLKHMVQDKIHCLTLDHKVLTLNGWKTYHDLSNEDLIKTPLGYESYNEKILYPHYTGNMYEIPKLGIKVTEDHRMYVSQSKFNRNFNLVKIQDIQYPIYYLTSEGIEIVNENDVIKTYIEDIPVFCLTMPNEVFMVKTNKHGIFTGNSRASGPKQKLTRQPPEGPCGLHLL